MALILQMDRIDRSKGLTGRLSWECRGVQTQPFKLRSPIRIVRNMSDATDRPGVIAWIDLTAQNAEETRAFYEKVAGWKSKPVPMGEYDDYCMDASDGQTIAGICHARGENTGLPQAWLVYINVVDLDLSLKACQASGGKVLNGPRQIGNARCAVIEDPAGAFAALYEPPKPSDQGPADDQTSEK